MPEVTGVFAIFGCGSVFLGVGVLLVATGCGVDRNNSSGKAGAITGLVGIVDRLGLMAGLEAVLPIGRLGLAAGLVVKLDNRYRLVHCWGNDFGCWFWL
jgi:hypothetical protein